MKEKIIVIGDGGHSKVVIDILVQMEIYDIIGVNIDIDKGKKKFRNFPISIGDESLKLHFKNGISKAAIGVGGYTNNTIRKEIFLKLKKLGFEIVNVIHPSVEISSTVKLGEGNVILPGVVLNTDVVIGNNVIVYTGSTVDHETIILDHTLISAGVTIGAYVKIYENSLIALGAKIVSGVKIGSDTLIAAGAVVVNDIRNDSKVFGLPAREK